ncbi:MAG TPA: hypothetical protein VMY40_00625 [Anaerolineae bacterium]|nr:hypothetical protein [Anaerolineae bacterium]
MDAKTKEKSARPLGVIGSLAAGFEMIGQHLWLIALPVLLDLLLWLGPRVSVASLVKQFAAFLLSRPVPDPATIRQVAQMAQLMEQFGERSNLLALLSALPLLTVPSLLAQHAPGVVSPLGGPYVLSTTSVLAVMAWGVVLVPIGLVLGFLYLNSLARWVHAMRSSDEPTPALSADLRSEVDGAKKAFRVSDSVGKFIRVLLFAAALLVSGMMLAPLWVLLVGTILATVPPLGMLVWSLSIGLGSYIVLHLLFVVPGVLVGGRGLLRAVWESILLIHTQFPSVMGLVLLVVVIYQGLGFVWSLPSGDSWLLLVGILGNGCIATGLTAAFFVFYQERVGQLPGAPQVSAGS